MIPPPSNELSSSLSSRIMKKSERRERKRIAVAKGFDRTEETHRGEKVYGRAGKDKMHQRITCRGPKTENE